METQFSQIIAISIVNIFDFGVENITFSCRIWVLFPVAFRLPNAITAIFSFEQEQLLLLNLPHHSTFL